ncbi:unnamed protein product, partial [Tetraodon nigroviridis]
VQGVVEFSLCLLFAKLVSYTFLFWLPLYITKAGEMAPGPSLTPADWGGSRRGPAQSDRSSASLTTAHLDAKKAGDLSTLFDVGGIVGGILAGVVSDKSGKRASTCAVMLLLAAPTVS